MDRFPTDKEYKVLIRHREDYSGEHRSWDTEMILPKDLVARIRADAIKDFTRQ